ncbi:MAG: helix-turn-helix transcriptional regulator [Clostridia bacterium]|nr:helix-turn-helix transcriptional regulator [Clostridia bacterium]
MGIKYRRLRNRMKAEGIKSYQLAEALKVSTQTLSRKLNGATPFTEEEIEKVCVVLKISAIDVWRFFFERLSSYEDDLKKLEQF